MTAVLLALLVVLGMPTAAARAAGSDVKVVVVVGPVGSSNDHYKADAAKLVAEAQKYTSNVVKLYTPNATWTRVKAAAQGASVFIYLGHGNGWPSPYPPFQTLTKDGLGLDPTVGADGSRHVYYGEDYIRNEFRFAPNAVVLLYHLCYASGNTEPGMATGSIADSRLRVDNYGAGFIGAGARAVIADGHPDTLVVDYVRQLFTSNRSIEGIFRAAANWHGHPMGSFASQRTPGLRYLMDPESTAPSGFYRSVVGDLTLTAPEVTGVLPSPSNVDPADFVLPGAAEVTADAGIPMFATAAAAADPAGTAAATLPAATRLRVTADVTPAPDGTRILAAAVLATTNAGFVRATDIEPRDSAGVVPWTLDQSAALLSPNADNVSDGLAVTARLSEPDATTLVVKNAAGTTVKSMASTGDIVRYAWDLTGSTGTGIADGAYTWTLRGAKDAWGNAGFTRTGTFTVDATAPVSTGSTATTTGGSGWAVAPVTLTVTARDTTSGVGSIAWRVDGAAARTYAGAVAIATNGTHLVEYRAVDKAGIREDWHGLTLKIDTVPPVLTLVPAGTAGDLAGWFRSPVSIKPGITDAASGVGVKRIAVDGATPVPLGTTAVVVSGDGPHTVTVTVGDVAGNKTSATTTFSIDATVPVVTLPDPAPAIATVTPNGDGTGEQVTIPCSISEPGTAIAVITDAAGVTVRTLTAPAALAGDATLAWDGRTAAGTPVPDGRYTISITGRDLVGNIGAAAVTQVDAYAALSALARTPALFFPQDDDRLAQRTTASFSLLSPTTVSIRVIDASGTTIRTGPAAAAMPAGPATWSWNGKLDDGTYAPRGTYRIVVGATNGTQASSLSTTVRADAFRVTSTTTAAKRGTTITITAVTAETLSTTPRVTVRQPGLAARVVTMTKVNATTWTATVVLQKGGTAGTLALTVRALDTAGGVNSSILRMALQ
ncbi:MAG: FlgD immunoglobulin-like domain containing protein [Chloroflexota bacterium]